MKNYVKFLCLLFVTIKGAHAQLNFGDLINPSPETKTPPVVYVLKPEFVGCNVRKNQEQEKLENLATSILQITKHDACKPNSLGLFSFSSKTCTDSIICKDNISVMYGNSFEKILDEIVATTYANNRLKKDMEAMDTLEMLKRFAKEKYNLKNENCSDRYEAPKEGKDCKLSLLDDVFVNQQKDSKDSAFIDYASKHRVPKLAYVVDYNQLRIDQKFKDMKERDNEQLTSLANFVTSEEFKNLAPGIKVEKFLKKLQSDSGKGYNDPILGFDFGPASDIEIFKKTPKYKDLMEMVSRSDVTSASFKSQFNNYRKDRALSILSDKNICAQTSSLKNICEGMTTLSKGEVLKKDMSHAIRYADRYLDNDEGFKKFASLMNNDISKNDYDILLNAKRCVSFGLAFDQMSFYINPNSWNNSPFQYSSSSSITGMSTSISTKNTSSSDSGDSEKNKAEKAEDPKLVDEEVSAKNSEQSVIEQAPTVANNYDNQIKPFYPSSNYGVDDESKNESTQKEDEAAVVNSTNTAPHDNKIDDLVKRLALAEENLEKMKASSEEAENKRLMEKKTEDLNAIIKDLKGQIAETKAKKENSQIERETVPNRPSSEQPRERSSNYSSNYSLGANNSNNSIPNKIEIVPRVAPDYYDSSKSATPISNASSANSRSGNSIVLTSSTKNEGSKVLPSGIVLTPVDGLSSEKVAQKISNKIIELNGTPFYIEEGGMVKEIIAVIKDGKIVLDDKGNPVYEKIIKGRVGDSKFAKASDKGRSPAAITDAADLKRDQEEKLKQERAEYLKLKNLTNQVIQNK